MHYYEPPGRKVWKRRRYRDRSDTRVAVYKLYMMRGEEAPLSAVMQERIEKMIAQSTSSGHRMNKGNSK